MDLAFYVLQNLIMFLARRYLCFTAHIKRFGLRTGDGIKGTIRKPKEGEKYFALQRIESINYQPPAHVTTKTVFENLTPLFPIKNLI
jgi:transcription termination factor Rho